MKYQVLACDYDGTLASDGIVDDIVVDALRRVRHRELRTILVTGRELTSLFNTFAHTDVFELVVAENGAVLHCPATESVEVIAPPPPPVLVSALQGARVPISVGHSIIATVTPHDETMRATIRELGLDWHVTYNKRAAMALPAAVNKATGLATALKALGVPARDCVGIGDAENDVEFMRMCGLSVAVSNALPQVKDVADVVLARARGAGVVELVTRLLTGEFDDGNGR